MTAASQICLFRVLNLQPKLRNIPNPGALLLIPPLAACQVNLKNVAAQGLLPGCPMVIYSSLASQWHPGGCWGAWIWFTQRSSLSMLDFTALCHCGTTDTSCSCPFQKYNLLLVFYCWLSGISAFNPAEEILLNWPLGEQSRNWDLECGKGSEAVQGLRTQCWALTRPRVQHVAILSALLLLIEMLILICYNQ